jgi:hypothetical protein
MRPSPIGNPWRIQKCYALRRGRARLDSLNLYLSNLGLELGRRMVFQHSIQEPGRRVVWLTHSKFIGSARSSRRLCTMANYRVISQRRARSAHPIVWIFPHSLDSSIEEGGLARELRRPGRCIGRNASTGARRTFCSLRAGTVRLLPAWPSPATTPRNGS